MKKYRKSLIILVGFVFIGLKSFGQDDLLDFLATKEEPVTNYTFATFKNTRLITGHSVETNGKGVLQFIIGHRFGRINAGWKELYGLDNAIIRFGFDYGITDRINIGVGRSSYQKTYDANIKLKLLRQKSGASNFPFTMTYVGGVHMIGSDWANPDRINYFSSRITYQHSLLLARKWSEYISIQLMPTVIHRNIVPTQFDHNSVYSLGVGSSIKMTGSLRLTTEYYYILPNQIVSLIGGEKVKNALSIGIDLETGGHVFQLHFTNSRGMTEKFLIGETNGSWANGDVHFGFNVSRVFTISKPKEFKE